MHAEGTGYTRIPWTARDARLTDKSPGAGIHALERLSTSPAAAPLPTFGDVTIEFHDGSMGLLDSVIIWVDGTSSSGGPSISWSR